MEKEETAINIQTYITLYDGNWKLDIAVKNDLTPYKEEDALYRFGSIETTGLAANDGEEIYWDNLPYFIDMTNEAKEECKKELKQKGQYVKGMMKNLKKLIKHAQNLNLI